MENQDLRSARVTYGRGIELAVGADLAFADLLACGDQFPTPVRDGMMLPRLVS